MGLAPVDHLHVVLNEGHGPIDNQYCVVKGMKETYSSIHRIFVVRYMVDEKKLDLRTEHLRIVK